MLQKKKKKKYKLNWDLKKKYGSLFDTPNTNEHCDKAKVEVVNDLHWLLFSKF